MENIINENSECPSDRVNIILKSLSKPKYQPVKDNDSDSEDEYNELFIRHRLRKKL